MGQSGDGSPGWTLRYSIREAGDAVKPMQALTQRQFADLRPAKSLGLYARDGQSRISCPPRLDVPVDDDLHFETLCPRNSNTHGQQKVAAELYQGRSDSAALSRITAQSLGQSRHCLRSSSHTAPGQSAHWPRG